MHTKFYTSTSTCGRNQKEACTTIGDWAFTLSHIPWTALLLETVLLLETCAIIRENTVFGKCLHSLGKAVRCLHLWSFCPDQRVVWIQVWMSQQRFCTVPRKTCVLHGDALFHRIAWQKVRTVVLEISSIGDRNLILCICFAINFSPHIAIIILGKPARFGPRF